MGTSNQLTEKEKLLEYYKSQKKNSLLGVAIIIACFILVESIVREFPEIMLSKIVFKNGFILTAGALHLIVIMLGGCAVIWGLISAGFCHLKINDLLNEH